MTGDAATRPDIPAAAKDCGCGPLEPCKPHLGAGDLPDWEARARAAEAKLAALEALCHHRAEQVRADYPGVDMPAVPVSAASILAITGSEKETP